MEDILARPVGPLLVFILRIVDVSLATLRILFAVRGRKLIAAVLGFVEILIWIVVIGSVVRNLGSPVLVLSYAAGFAAGTYAGMTIEEKLALGLAEVRAISATAGVEIAQALRDQGFGVTEVIGQGLHGRVENVQTIVPRRHLVEIHREIDRWDPDAFVSVDEPRAIYRGWLFSRRAK